ncbi:tyrosine-protein kinase-like [Pelodytes ibericus]
MGLRLCRACSACCPCSCCQQTDAGSSEQKREHDQHNSFVSHVHRPPHSDIQESLPSFKSHSTFKSFIQPQLEKNRQSLQSAGPPILETKADTQNQEVARNLQSYEQRLEGIDNASYTPPADENDAAPGMTGYGGSQETPEKEEKNTAKKIHKRTSSKVTLPLTLSRMGRAEKVSCYHYKPRSSQDLGVRKGETLEVIKYSGEWAFAKKTTQSGEVETGYIHSSYLADVGSLEAEDWYFGTLKRLDVKRFLLQQENKNGSFLVWKNEDAECYYLSVRLDTADTSLARHYRIQQKPGSFYLVERAPAKSIEDLVRYYQDQSDGLCTRLEQPCVKLDLPSMASLSHTTVDKLEIHPNSIQKIRSLGRGSFGFVWLGMWNGTTEVAIKELKVTAASLKHSLYGEAETMWKLNHERLLKLYAVCLQAEPVFIVTEYMKHGTLKSYLTEHQSARDLELHYVMDFAVQISQGMDYMERNSCVHRDLRTENILLSAMMSCKIGDFGMARFMENSSVAISAGAKVPIKWMAPEVFQTQKYTNKSDVWSFGVLLVEIITYGKIPFPEKNNQAYIEDILSGTPLQPPAQCPGDVENIMAMCWERESYKRPSFSEIELLLMNLLKPTLSEDTVE